MKKSATFRFMPLSLSIAIAAGFSLQTAYAVPITVTASVPLTTEVTPVLKQINANTVASYKALDKTLNNAFFAPDNMFLNTSTQNNNQLGNMQLTQNNGLAFTQDSIDQQLKTFSYKINTAYTNFSLLKQSMVNPSNNLVNKLTYMTPSYDTLHLPRDSTQGMLYTELNSSTLPVSTPAALKANAQRMNFDAFFNPSSYSKTGADAPAASYIDYALQTYDPLIPASPQPNASGAAASQNSTIFGLINSKLTALKGGDGQKAYAMLDSILKNAEFQKFWLSLRSYEAKRSLLLSNFNFIRAERTPQTGLGTAYGLKGADNKIIKDASPLQVESLLINNTVNNPTWYKNMKTAPPVTIAREQLLLTSLLVKLEFKNQLINERNLATLSMMTDAGLQTSKQLLTLQELKLKQKLFPQSAPKQQQPMQQQLDKYRK